MKELYREFKQYENEALGCGAIPHTYESWLEWQLRQLQAENRALHAKIETALAIPEPQLLGKGTIEEREFFSGTRWMHKEFRKALTDAK